MSDVRSPTQVDQRAAPIHCRCRGVHSLINNPLLELVILPERKQSTVRQKLHQIR